LQAQIGSTAGAGFESGDRAAREPDFADICLAHFRGCWPIEQWLLESVAD